jgi:hypothetical protein
MIAMNFDDVFIGIVVGGIALSGAYIRAEYRSWRSRGAALRRRDSVLHELHAASLSQQQDALLEPSVVRLQKFTDTDAAAADEIAAGEAPRRSHAQSGSQRIPFVERRARERHQATL